MKNRFVIVLSLFISTGVGLMGQVANLSAQGSVAGKVVDENGAPLALASIQMQRIPAMTAVASDIAGRAATSAVALAPGEVYASGSSVASTLGAYSINGLLVGNYLLCVEVPGQAFLNPCKWDKAIALSVLAGSSSAMDIHLEKGVLLKVHVSDPKGLLAPDRRPLGPPPLIVGVKYGAGAFLAADYTAGAGGGDFVMPIPVGVTMHLWVYNPSLTLTDDGRQGALVNVSGDNGAFTAVDSSEDQTYSFTVAGAVVTTGK